MSSHAKGSFNHEARLGMREAKPWRDAGSAGASFGSGFAMAASIIVPLTLWRTAMT
jgi:hypothetical protein